MSYEYDALDDVYYEPETDLSILGEDMPDELRPAVKRNPGSYIDDLLILRIQQPTRSVPVPFEEIVNWQLHPTRPVAPVAHRRA